MIPLRGHRGFSGNKEMGIIFYKEVITHLQQLFSDLKDYKYEWVESGVWNRQSILKSVYYKHEVLTS